MPCIWRSSFSPQGHCDRYLPKTPHLVKMWLKPPSVFAVLCTQKTIILRDKQPINHYTWKVSLILHSASVACRLLCGDLASLDMKMKKVEEAES